VSISGTGTGYTNGGAATADCTGIPSCTGSGFAATCTSDGNTVSALFITSKGSGYNAAAPPLITCAGGTGHTFTPLVDQSTGGTNCADVEFTAIMQFASSGETWADAETALPNAWWGGDAASAGATLQNCGEYKPYRIRLDTTIDFSSDTETGDELASDWPGEGANSLADGKWFSVRWTGFVLPAAAGEHTFHATLKGADERVKVWIDNSLLIDQWSSLGALTPAATYGALSTTSYYSLSAEYKQEEGDRQIKVRPFSGTPLAGVRVSISPIATETQAGLLAPSTLLSPAGGVGGVWGFTSGHPVRQHVPHVLAGRRSVQCHRPRRRAVRIDVNHQRPRAEHHDGRHARKLHADCARRILQPTRHVPRRGLRLHVQGELFLSHSFSAF
jgi:hypothetical protein